MKRLSAAAVWLAASASAMAGLVGERWSVAGRPAAHAGAVKVVRQGDAARIVVDLSALPKAAKVRAAELRIFRTAAIAGRDDDARVAVDIRPSAGGEAAAMKLLPPWYDRLDATAAVSAAAGGQLALDVKACPRWDANATCLDITCEAAPRDVPTQPTGLNVHHRAGQTFIVFRETDDRSAAESPAWGELKARLDRMDAEHAVRYRVYRSAEPITAESLPAAELLGEVKPMSGYNVLGRSVDQLIAQHRRRAIDDLEFAKQLARDDYFTRYNPDMPEMAEVAIRRLAVEDGKPLPAGLGLYVHQPARAGKACYAVVAVADGTANLKDFSPANALGEPVAETVGAGEPVLQGRPDVTVFHDYPGQRYQYVQWAAPPLANLPNQYCNWGLFVPGDYEAAKVKRLSVFFHDARQRYLKPPWPHRRDTVLLSPHDAPFRSYGFGYHEALGTLRSFTQGVVRPFFARRVDQMLDWALAKFAADRARVSCGGSGPWGGTAALQYGLRRPGRIAYVMADGPADADPRQTPYEFSYYGRGDTRKTDRPNRDDVWGRAEWNIPAEGGRPVWREMDLVAHVQAEGKRRALPYLSLGAGSMHLTWKQETDLMKALLQTRSAFMAEFFWGSSAHRPLPVTAETGDGPFEPRADAPLLACEPKKREPNPGFFDKQFATGERGYGAGGRLNTRPRWDGETIVDAPDRLEMTIFSARRVVYAGGVDCDVTVRNTRQFSPRPGEKLAWTVTDTQTNKVVQQGAAEVDREGHVRIADLRFAAPGRLVVRKTKDGD